MKKKRSKQPIWVFIAVPAACGLVAIVAFGQPGRKGLDAKVAPARPRTAVQPLVSSKAAIARKPLAFYTGGVKGDLFAAPEAAPPVKAAPPPKVEPVAAPAPVDPFVDYAYTGTVSMGDRAVALIENAKTKEGLYVSVGDSFIGGQVTAVTDRMVTVNVAGRPHSLSKSDDFKLTPLDKSASFLTASPTPAGVPGGPGGPGGPMGPGGMGQMSPADRQQRVQQWLDRLPADQRQRIQERMLNRQFNGGGGGRRGGGGFGGGGFGGFGFGG